MAVQAPIFLFQIKLMLHVNSHIFLSFGFSVCFASNQELFSRALQWWTISNLPTIFPQTETEVTSPTLQEASSAKDPAKASSRLCQSSLKVEIKMVGCLLFCYLFLPKQPRNKQKTEQGKENRNTRSSITLRLPIHPKVATNHTLDND